MYDLVGYGDMIADGVRTSAYARALQGCVTRSSSVLDIGTGTGLFALLACRFGARHVYAVEPSDAIALAKDIARANGYSERITFIQKTSDRIEVAEPVDVIVSDIRGVLPMCQKSLQSIIDARDRLLAHDGILIPARDRLMAAPLDSPRLCGRFTQPWESSIHDLDMTTALGLVRNAWYKARAQPRELLARPGCWATLDYRALESAAVSGETGWTAEREGTVSGLSVWFDAELGAGAMMSNAPDQPELIYGSAFFPLSNPVDVSEGDRIDVRFRADPVGDDYVWSWTTTFRSPRHPDRPETRFEQSTFFANPMVRAQLHKRASSHRPQLSEEGGIALLVLELMKKSHTIEEIATRLCDRYPARFDDWHAAFQHACAFSGKYSENPAEDESTEEPVTGADRPPLSRYSNG